MITIEKSRKDFLVAFVIVSCSFHDQFVVLFVVVIKASAQHSSLHNQGLNQHTTGSKSYAQWKTEFVSMNTIIVIAYNETIAFACF